ncbi:hypothetical protein EJ08DRAFT_658055 [Tothia fuscella]|uniref:DUF8035 domain-containing protein n=1 Tax=Tothia fuscella TaxID=1048955 RepID=A0A9P4NYK9_9PEZI|nr:hypothetical protein EJ08DRAFT_658055 [Tothia fuscella]
MTASYLTGSHEHTRANSAKKAVRKAKASADLSCRACDASHGIPTAAATKTNSTTPSIGLNMSDPRYSHHYRASSPGARKLVLPGRSSTGTVGATSYNEPLSAYSRSPRDTYLDAPPPRTTTGGGVIPISTDVYANYGPSSASTSKPRDSFSGRPRSSTIEGAHAPPVIRSRPAVVHTSAVVRPSSPLSRYEPRDAYVKTAATPRREHKTTMYSVDNGSAKLIAETETAARGRDARDSSHKDRGNYHLTGSSARPREREVEDEMFSYTDAAGMYRDTEPRWRPRRGSVDRGNRRPTSVIEPFGPSSGNRASRDMGPPPSTRGFQKISSDLGRTSSVRDPVRSSSRERSGTYDSYGNGVKYEMPIRGSSTLPVEDQGWDSRYYEDEFGKQRDSRRHNRVVDDAVETRGFGIRRSSSVDRHALPPSYPPPPPSTSAVGIYTLPNEPLGSMPTREEYTSRTADSDRRSSALLPPRDYTSRDILEDRRGSAIPPSKDYLSRPPEDMRRSSDVPVPSNYLSRPPEETRRGSDIPPSKEYLSRPLEENRRGSEDRRDRPPPSHKDYLPRPLDDDRRGSEDRRERDRTIPSTKEYVPRVVEDDRRGSQDRRERDRDYDRPKDRDYERSRHKDRDHNRDEPRKEHEERIGVAVPAAAAAVGAVAAGAALSKHSRDKKYDSDEDRDRNRRAPRSEPNAAEDEREQRYADRDRARDEERKKDHSPKQEEVDPDEEYRRRVQQQAEELSQMPQVTRQRSREGERSDSDHERRRRPERDERERRERRKDDPSEAVGLRDVPRREKGYDSRDDVPASREMPRQDRELDFDDQASQQHNRYDKRHNSILDNGFVDEPDALDRDRGGPPTTDLVVAKEAASRNASTSGQSERRVTIVEPPKKEPSPEPRVKGILRKPTEKFPEHPNPIREGVAPLKEKLDKEKHAKDIPSGAKWTKIDRRLVNPQSLEEKGERYEERMDCVIVLRVLTKAEIQEFADRTKEIRGERDDPDSKPRHHKHHDKEHDHDYNENESSDDDRERRHRREKEKRKEKERVDRESGKDRDSHRDKDRERSRREYDPADYSAEEDSVRKAIDDGRSSRHRSSRKDREEEYVGR